MKKRKHLIALLTAAVLTLGTPAMAFAADPPAAPAGAIHVRGTAVVLAEPDVAVIHIEAENEGKTGAEAQQKTNEEIQKITSALLKAGIAKEKIITEHTGLHPIYDYTENGGRIFRGYMASAALSASTKNVKQAGKYVDAAINAGASRINGVSFDVENKTVYYAQALNDAVKNAASSAQAIAKACGRPLGEITEITENSRNIHTEIFNGMPAKEEGAADSAAPQTSISYDKIRITADLSVSYRF